MWAVCRDVSWGDKVLQLWMEPDTEACNVDNHGVHNDDDNGCGDGVQHRGLYWKLQCNADDGWWLSPMLRLVIFFSSSFLWVLFPRGTLSALWGRSWYCCWMQSTIFWQVIILQKVQPKRAVQADEGPIQRLPFLCEGQGGGGGREQGQGQGQGELGKRF